MWIDSNQLPLLVGIMLFQVKLVRAINDNVASVFYNATGSIAAYFWLGFGVTLGSLLCSEILTRLHSKIIEPMLK